MIRSATTFVLSLALLGGAPGTSQAQAPPCRAAGEPLDLLADREEVILGMQRLPPACLEQLMSDCSAAAGQGMLDGGSAAVCSLGYEAMLRGRFHGDFNALLAWWRSERTARR